MTLRITIAVLTLALASSYAAAQSGALPITARPLPLGTFSVGLVGSGVFPIVTSDVVGPDSPEGSHKRTTITAGLQGGIEAAWEFLRLSSATVSLRARYAYTTALAGTEVVHQHVDPVTYDGRSYIVTTDHGVRHAVQRQDLQALLGVEPRTLPLRFLAGVSVLAQSNDVVEEIYHEIGRVEVVPVKVPQHGQETSVIYRVTNRVGLLAGVQLPLRLRRLEVAAHVMADLGLATTVEQDIPTTSHLLLAGISCSWRF